METLWNRQKKNVAYIATALAAAMLFFAQPTIGKMLNPNIGGAPIGWLIVMLWFQVTLWLGTCLSEIFSRLPLRYHISAIIIVGVVSSWHGLQAINNEETLDTWTQTLWAVMFSLGFIPIFLGSVTATIARTVTSWGEDSRKVFLFSNIGSFIGLGAALVFDLFGSIESSKIILQISIGLVVLLLTLLAGTKNNSYLPTITTRESFPIFQIILYAGLGCALLNAITLKIATDMGSVPLAWLPPLALYLLSFVLAFSKLIRFNHIFYTFSFIAIGIILLIPITEANQTIFGFICNLIAFFCIVVHLHCKIAELKPLSEKAQTLFTLSINTGGLLGGAIVSSICPIIFSDNWEFYIILLLILATTLKQPLHKVEIKEILLLIGLVGLTAVVILGAKELKGLALLFLMSLAFVNTHRMLAVCCLMFILLSPMLFMQDQTITSKRGYFGVVKVLENNGIRQLLHGTTVHGEQEIRDGKYINTALTYYTKEGPLGEIMELHQASKVLVIGLGIGAMNSYPTKSTVFIEIDKNIINIAKNYFGYVTEDTRIIEGDGRIELSKLNEKFDLIILDAFSSDSIPLHLLTTAALEIYKHKITENGEILIHASNRFYNLIPLLANNAKSIGLTTSFKADNAATRTPSTWVILSKDTVPKGWNEVEGADYIWSDNKGSLLWLLR